MAVAPAALTLERSRNALLWSKEIRRLGPNRLPAGRRFYFSFSPGQRVSFAPRSPA